MFLGLVAELKVGVEGASAVALYSCVCGSRYNRGAALAAGLLLSLQGAPLVQLWVSRDATWECKAWRRG